MEIWHERIKSLRENTDVTLKDMAKIIGVSEATVQRYECGKIHELPYKVITAYAEKFHVSPSYIMGWEDNAPSSELIELALKYEPDYTDSKKTFERLSIYSKGFLDLMNLASTFNEQGIDDLTKYAKLMSKSEEYKKEE